MFVPKNSQKEILKFLYDKEVLALDTETTGLYPYHGDRLFCIVIADEHHSYYFDSEELDEESWIYMHTLFGQKHITWRIHNAKYDLAILAQEGAEIEGRIWCTMSASQVIYNQHFSYSLEACAKRSGMEKSKEVEAFIRKNRLSHEVELNGKRIKKLQYERVPKELMLKYACQDARVCYILGESQAQYFATHLGPRTVWENERALTKTLFEMEKLGALVDVEYCQKAMGYERRRMEFAKQEFETLTGRKFCKSNKQFQEIFSNEKEKFGTTKKGGASIDKATLEKLEHPAAKLVLDYAKAKKNSEYFEGFLHYRDSKNRIHTNYNQNVATGRLSSRSPNLQNLTNKKDDSDYSKYPVRRAIIPSPGFFFAKFDYDQIEFRLMLNYAKANKQINAVLGGLDVHEATARAAGVTRKEAKMTNFLTIYGGGSGKLAAALDTTEEKALSIREKIFNSAPEVKWLIRSISNTAEKRGWVHNWLGRRLQFPNSEKSYIAPNHVMQGGAGDVIKVAKNAVSQYLSDKKSRMVLTVHDELDIEIAYGEEFVIPKIKRIMEDAFPYKELEFRLPLTVGVEFSSKSLEDMGTEIPGGEETRNQVQGDQGSSGSTNATELLVRKDPAIIYSRNTGLPALRE